MSPNLKMKKESTVKRVFFSSVFFPKKKFSCSITFMISVLFALYH